MASLTITTDRLRELALAALRAAKADLPPWPEDDTSDVRPCPPPPPRHHFQMGKYNAYADLLAEATGQDRDELGRQLDTETR
jgi:hypothetical protein